MGKVLQPLTQKANMQQKTRFWAEFTIPGFTPDGKYIPEKSMPRGKILSSKLVERLSSKILKGAYRRALLPQCVVVTSEYPSMCEKSSCASREQEINVIANRTSLRNNSSMMNINRVSNQKVVYINGGL